MFGAARRATGRVIGEARSCHVGLAQLPLRLQPRGGRAVAANDEGPASEPNLAGLALRAEVGYALAPTPNEGWLRACSARTAGLRTGPAESFARGAPRLW